MKQKLEMEVIVRNFQELPNYDGEHRFIDLHAQNVYTPGSVAEYLWTNRVQQERNEHLEMFVGKDQPESEEVVLKSLEHAEIHEVCECGCALEDANCCSYEFYFRKIFEPLTAYELGKLYEAIVESYNLILATKNMNREDMLETEYEQFEYRLRHMKVVKGIFLMNDDLLILSFRELEPIRIAYTLDLIYKIREIFNDFKDYGLQFAVNNYRNDMSSQGITGSRMFLDLTESLRTNETIITIKDYVNEKLENIWNKLKELFNFVSTKLKDLASEAFKVFKNYAIEKILGPFGLWLFTEVKPEHRKIIVAAIFFSLWVGLSLTHLFSQRVLNFLLGFSTTTAFVNIENFNMLEKTLKSMGTAEATAFMNAYQQAQQNNYHSQGEHDLISLLFTVCVTVIGVRSSDFMRIKSMALDMIKLMQGGTIISNTLKALLVLLPPVLKMSFVYRFGTPTQRLEFDIENWKSRSQSLCAISKLQQVIGSKVYASRINDAVKEGGDLVRRCSMDVKSSIKTSLMTTYVKLINIHTNLMTKKYSSKSNHLPFAFHFAGEPGIGKTTSIIELLNRSCKFPREDLYFKDVADEYFSGLLNHPVMVMDEFLLGDAQTNYSDARTYLTMVSTGEWRPNFASVDDPNVGIKGNVYKPKIVVTMNNTIYDMIDAKIDNAFQRRRRFVIYAKRSDLYRSEENNESNVDLANYTEEERIKRVWMKFDIMPSIFKVNAKPIIENLSFDELVDFVRGQYEKHEELANMLQQSETQEFNDKQPEEIIDEILRDTYSIPIKTPSFSEMFSFVSHPFSSQGPSQDNQTVPENYGEQARQEFIQEGEVATVLLDDSQETWWNRAYQRLTGMLGKGVMLTSAVIAILTYVATSVHGQSNEEDTYYAQSKPSNKTSKAKQRSHNWRQVRTTKLESQGPIFVTHDLVVNGEVRKCISLKERWFLTYAHGLQISLQITNHIKMRILGQEYEEDLDLSNVYISDENDVAIFKLENKHVPMAKDIIKWFITEDEIDFTQNNQIIIHDQTRYLTSIAMVGNNLEYTTENNTRIVKLEKALKYRAPTMLGDCGMAVKIISGGLCSKIAGIHVAGTGENCQDPIGVATFVTQEMIRSVTNEISCQGPNLEGPNLIYEKQINWNEVVNMPTNTKLRKSKISEFLPYKSHKQPAILHSSDPRSNGLDPIDESLKKLCQAESIEVDQRLVDRIENELYEELKKGLVWKAGKRMLSFEEACEGIPGILNSITTKTNPGYPLCNVTRKKGKTDFVWFEGGKLCYNQSFKVMVLEFIKQMNEFNGEEINHRFLAFLKDELRSDSKIDSVSTRMTFANDMIALVAFRMVFGCLLVALRSSFEVTGFALGLNQYSKDMNGIYTYLKKKFPQSQEDKMGAGDYSEFDMRFQTQFETSSYNVIKRLAKSELGVSNNACEFMHKHETCSPFQVGNRLILVKTSNKSGGFWTTELNCLQNRSYFMYIFYLKYPEKLFVVEIAVVILGDDHIYNCSKNIEFLPTEVRDYMKLIGQKYTSAFKDKELKPEYEKFDEILFLGAQPRRSLEGCWTGALRKATLEETPLWTRDKDLSLDQTNQQMLDCASQWDQEYFESYANNMREAYRQSGRVYNLYDNYHALHHSVLNRTAASGSDFYTFHAQGPVGLETISETKVVSGFNQVVTSEEKEPSKDSGNLNLNIKDLSISAEKVKIDYGTGTFVRRIAFDWSSTSTQGTILNSYDIPFDLLTATNLTNAQNIGFMNFLYSQPEIEVAVQINGTPVQQGALCVFFAPLIGTAASWGIINWTNFDHIILTPNNNSTKILTIPFRFWKTWLNNRTGFTTAANQSLGVMYIGVLSQLTTTTLPTTASVTLYTRFKSEFTIPRPRSLTGQGPFLDFVTNNSSVSNSINSVSGDVPMQNGSTTSNSTQLNANMQTLPLDDPPISGGSNPVYGQFSSLSKAVGLEPTVSLQMNQMMLHRQPLDLSFKTQTLVEEICSRRGYLGTTSVSTSTAVGTSILEIPINSIFTNSYGSSVFVPPNVAALNQFQRWRANIEIEFFAAKTVFHSVRFQAVMAYGYDSTVTALDWNGFPSEIVEFSSETQWRSITIPFNAPVEYLRTFDGQGASSSYIRDYSMGNLSLIVSNALKVSSGVVPSTISILYFVRFHDVEVYEPKPNAFVDLDGEQLYTLVGQGPMDEETLINTSSSTVSGTKILNTEKKEGDDDKPETIPVTTENSKTMAKPCDLALGRKYEYLVRDITEIGRRHHQFNVQAQPGYSYKVVREAIGTTESYTTQVSPSHMSFYVKPVHPICKLYAGWSGHLKYRFILSYGATSVPKGLPSVSYVPSVPASVTEVVATSLTGAASPWDSTPTSTVNNTTVFDMLITASPGSTVGRSADPAVWNSNTYIWKSAKCINSPAIEYFFPVSANTWMIDISVPFNTPYNYLPTQDSTRSGIDQYNGRIIIRLPLSNELFVLHTYQAFGDDFRLHHYCPNVAPCAAGYYTNGSFTSPPAGTQLGANVYN